MIIHGDALQTLKGLESESIDCIVTDPPYGYSFMNKDWDKAVVSVETWKECLRVLKSGAFAFIMSSPRQDVLCKMILNLIDAGFETNFTSIYWSYAQGFPKASNTEVVLRKRYATDTKTQMFQLWRNVFNQTPRIEKDNNRGNLQNLLEDLEQGKQYEIYAYTGSQSKNLQIPERQRQSSMEGWSLLQKEKGELCHCKVCKMPIGLYFNGKKGWICYGTQIDNGSISWQAIDENGMCSSYKSQPIGQSFRELDVICEQCITQKIRDSNLSGSYLGFQPKPAVEVILCVQKPIKEKSFVDQALKNGKGCTWLDDCRIPFQNQDDRYKEGIRIAGTELGQSSGWNNHENKDTVRISNPKGRFPANLIVSDDALNDGKIRKSSAVGFKGNPLTPKKGWNQNNMEVIRTEYYNDSGSYSRYFDLDAWFLAIPKASASERNKGLENSETKKSVNDGRKINCDVPAQRGQTFKQNFHPTVKPIKLMSYLITMGSRENDLILDPFCGSGTTCIAATILNRRYIGIELQREYVDIANKRLESYTQERKITDFA